MIGDKVGDGRVFSDEAQVMECDVGGRGGKVTRARGRAGDMIAAPGQACAGPLASAKVSLSRAQTARALLLHTILPRLKAPISPSLLIRPLP